VERPEARVLGERQVQSEVVLIGDAPIARPDDPVVLVGHSYGSVVVTDAAAGHENVEHLVYVTSVMP
jgi:pimeloyl-ACP methyl ester carboxylesterase